MKPDLYIICSGRSAYMRELKKIKQYKHGGKEYLVYRTLDNSFTFTKGIYQIENVPDNIKELFVKCEREKEIQMLDAQITIHPEEKENFEKFKQETCNHDFEYYVTHK